MPEPIIATLIGPDCCHAEGHTIYHPVPGLAICCKLVELGYDPERPLHAYRGDRLAMEFASIGWAAAAAAEPKLRLRAKKHHGSRVMV